MGSRREGSWIAYLLCLTAMLLTGGAAAAEPATPRRGGTLVYAVIGDPPTYDCHAGTSFAVLHYVAPHYSLLLSLNPGNTSEVRGDLAKDWTVSSDGLAYTFYLHDNVLFHDGTKLTSTDVKASFDRIRQPPAGIVSVRQSIYQPIVAIEAPDPHTVTFRLKAPWPGFLLTVANPFNCIYSAAKLAQDPAYPVRNVMGSGPFVFVEHVAGSQWRGKRFDRYFREGLPYLDGFQAVSMNSANLASALQGGQVMAEFRSVSPAIRDRLTAALGDKVAVAETPYAFGVVLVFNTERKPFDDPRVRRALSLAIDRWSGAEALSRTSMIRWVGATERPGSVWAATDDELAKLPGLGRDVAANREEAKRLLKEAGQENLTFKLTNRNVSDPYVTSGIYMIDQWRRIGVTVEHVQLDLAPLLSTMSGGNFDAIIDFSSELVDDPSMELARYVSADRSSVNPARYVDREIDALYDRQHVETDPVERRRLVRTIEQRIYEQAYMVPFLWLNRTVIMSSAIRGWELAPSSFLNQDLARIWLDR